MTTNTIANLTTEQITAYTNEYKELAKKSIKSFDQKEFEAHYEAVKTRYFEEKVFNYIVDEGETKAKKCKISHARFKLNPEVMLRDSNIVGKYRTIKLYHNKIDCLDDLKIADSFHFNNQIEFFKAMTDFLEENKEDFNLCTNTNVVIDSTNNTYTSYGKFVPVVATKEKQKADLKDLKKLTLDLYKEYIEINNQEALKEISTIEDYIQKQEAKKNAAKLAEIQTQLMEEQQKAIDTAVDEIVLAESFDFDISTIQDVIDDVKEERLENKFKMKDLTKALTNSVVEGDIDFIDINNDRVVSETLKAQGFEKKHTNTGSVWVVA